MIRKRQSKKRLKSLMSITLLITILSVFEAYAWFSTNTKVLLQGINAKVAAAEGLQISLDGDTWKSTIDLSQATFFTIPEGGTFTKTAIGGVNAFNWPDELNPVSTDGLMKTNASDLQFLQGELQEATNGDQTLSNTGAVTLNNTSASNNGSFLIAFDLYFKNSSSNTTDYLLLNSTSSIVSTVTGTGLEYSVRVGLVVYDSSALVTASGNDVRDLEAGTTPQVTIWEPNQASHIQQIVDNDARVSGTTETTFLESLGLVAAPGDQKINGTSEVEGYLKKQHTLATSTGTVGTATYMPLTSATSAAATTTTPDSATNYVKLKGNAIQKARVYIWLEGQDPDCVDVASTGESLTINLGFTKPATTPTT